MNKELKVDAFVFTTKEDADRAAKEKKQVAYLKTHMDLSSVEKVKAIYEKSNKERLFRTPIGLAYMQELYNALIRAGVSSEELLPVFVQANFEQRLRPQSVSEKQNDAFKQKQEKLRSNFRISVVLNLILLIAVAAMFVITLKSDNPNILNYESALQNRYSAWEQELNEREQALREKELEQIRE